MNKINKNQFRGKIKREERRRVFRCAFPLSQSPSLSGCLCENKSVPPPSSSPKCTKWIIHGSLSLSNPCWAGQLFCSRSDFFGAGERGEKRRAAFGGRVTANRTPSRHGGGSALRCSAAAAGTSWFRSHRQSSASATRAASGLVWK